MKKLSANGRLLVDAISKARSDLAASSFMDDEGVDVDVLPANVSSHSPLVSVEVLAFNQGRYLRQCVESIARQKTDFPFEIIIGNDCSVDDTQSVAEELQREYPDMITLVVSHRNVGLNRNARNVRRLMRGEFAAFCEGDDWWLGDNRLQLQVDFMRAHANVTLLHGLSSFYDEKSGVMHGQRARFNIVPDNALAHILDETYRVETATVMCRVKDIRRIYEECPELIGPKYRMLDTQFFALLASYGKVALMDEQLSVRRITGSSLSRNDDVGRSLKYHDSAFKMRMDLCEYFKVGSAAKKRAERYYVFSAFNILNRQFGVAESIEILGALYPGCQKTIRICWMLPWIRFAILWKLFNHIIAPTIKYRFFFEWS